VAASVILDDAYGLMRWDPADLEDSEKADGRRSLSTALQQVWEAWWWGPLMLLQQLALRPLYVDGVFQSHGTETYFAATRKYYLAIQPSIGIPPASLVNGAYATNTGFWAESARCYSGNDVDNTLAYDWGTVVRNPDDGFFYQRGGSLQVSGTNATFANQNYQVHTFATSNDRVVYWPGTAPSNDYNQASHFLANAPWQFVVVDDTPAIIADYVAGSADPLEFTPDLASGWRAFTGSLPGPTFTRSFVAPAPPDLGHWGLLKTFDPVLTISTRVRTITREQPDRGLWHTHAYHFTAAPGGVRVPEWTCDRAWVASLRVTPVITGNDYDPAQTYTATAPNELTYDA
jgi:hypothetical protein